MLTGRTQHGKPLVCLMRTVVAKRFIGGVRISVLTTDKEEMRLGAGMHLDDFEVGSTYFLQTVKFNFKQYQYQVVDFIKP